MSRKNKQPQQKTTSAKAAAEIPFTMTAPRRDGFSILDWRAAIKQAENITNPSRIKLLDYYNDILTDLHLSAVIGKRIDNIKATKFRFTSTKGKENAAIELLMRSVKFREMTADWLSSKFFGPVASWIDLSGGLFNKYSLIPRKHFVPEKGIILHKQTDRNGIDILSGSYPAYVMTVGQANDLGELLKAIPWVLFKRGDISDWATFNELYAFPFRIAKYPQYDQVAKEALAASCRESASNGFAIIPDTTSFEFIQAQSASSADAFERFATFCDKQMSKGFVRNTLTLDAEGGKYKGDIHAEGEKSVYTSDRQYIVDILNGRFLELLEIHGFNPADGEFSVEVEDHICLQDRILIDERLSKIVEVDPAYYYHKYGVWMPQGGPKAAQHTQPMQLSDNSLDILALRREIEQLRNLHEQLPMDADKPRKGFFD